MVAPCRRPGPVQAKHIALTDTWSHTVAAQRWPNYEWLSEVLMLAGLPGRRTAGRHDMRRHPSGFCADLLVEPRQGTAAAAGHPDAGHASLRHDRLEHTSTAHHVIFFVPLWVWLLLHRRWMWTALVAVLWTNLHGGAAYAVLLAGTAATVAGVQHRAALRPYILGSRNRTGRGILYAAGRRLLARNCSIHRAIESQRHPRVATARCDLGPRAVLADRRVDRHSCRHAPATPPGTRSRKCFRSPRPWWSCRSPWGRCGMYRCSLCWPCPRSAGSCGVINRQRQSQLSNPGAILHGVAPRHLDRGTRHRGRPSLGMGA